MADVAPVAEFQKIRDAKAKRQAQMGLTQAILEQDPEEVHELKLVVEGVERVFRYRIWTHAQANMLYRLPFVERVGGKLTEKEATAYHALQIELVLAALVDAEKWKPFLLDAKNLKLMQVVYSTIASFSGWTEEFDHRLEEFMDDERGMAYGYFWFVIQGLSPADVGRKSDLEVKAMNVWLSKWASKLKERA